MGELRWTIISANDGQRILDHDPKGWDTLKLKFVRDEFYHGVFYEFSGGDSEIVPVGFYCKGGGKEFIDLLYKQYGQEADAYMRIEYRCQDGSFEEMYYGKLNFASYEEKYENQKLYSYLNIEQFGITQKVRNREDVPVDVCNTVSLDGVSLTSYQSCYNLNLHSKTIYLESNWVKDEDFEICTTYLVPAVTANYFSPGFSMRSADIRTSNEVENFFYNNITVPGNRPILQVGEDEIYILPSVFNIEWDVSGTFTDTSRFNVNAEPEDCGTGALNLALRSTGGDPMRLYLYYGNNLLQAITDSSYVVLVDIPAWAAGSSVEVKPFSGSGTVQITLNPGDKAWLLWGFLYDITFAQPHDITRLWEYNDSFLKIWLDSNAPATVSKASLIHEAWSRLSEQITDQTIAFKSEYYGRTNSQPINYPANGCNSFAAITSGKLIRGFGKLPGTYEPITISLKQMFSNGNGVDNVGLGIETGNTIRVEKKKYFYDDTVIFEKGYVPGITIKLSPQFIYNEIKTGYSNWKIQEVNGLDEPNTNRKFALPDIRTLKNNLNAVSDFVAGMYTLEATRRKDVVRFPTTDYQYDENIFLIALNRSVNGSNQPNQLNIAEKDENFLLVTDLYFSNTAYNLRYSPTMNLLRWFPIYSIGMSKIVNYQNYWIIILTDYEGNVLMTTKLNQHAAPKCPGEFGYESSGFFIPLTLVEKPQYPSPVGGGVVDGYAVPAAPFTVAQMYGEPLFMPEEITFEHPVSYSEFKVIKNNPKGLVRIAADGLNFMSGYIKTFEFDLRRKMGSFVLYRKS